MMDFSLEMLYNTEKEMKGMLQQILKNCKTSLPADLNQNVLMKLNKDVLANYVKNLVSVLEKNIELCQSAAVEMDKMKTEQIANQKKQICSVQETVKTELKTWADVAKKNTDQSMTVYVRKVKEAVKTVVAEEDRSKRFMIFGVAEEDEEQVENLPDFIEETLENCGMTALPVVQSIYRVGAKKTGTARPIRVHMMNAGDVQRVLRAAPKLRSCQCNFRTVYLAPDRSKEEQLAHAKLVREMKELIQKDGSKYYYIRNCKIVCVDKALSTE